METIEQRNKPLTFLLAPTILFLFSGSVFGDEKEVKKEYWDNEKLRSEEHYKDGKKEGLWTRWYKNGQKKYEKHYKDGNREGLRTGWYRNEKKMSEGHFKDGKKMDFGLNGMKMGRKHSNELSKMETNS